VIESFSLSKKNLDVLLLVTGIFAFLRLPGSTDSCEDPPETEDCCKAVVDLENLFSITDLNLGVLVSRELTEVTEPFRKERVGNRFSFEVILVLLLLRLIFITVGFRFLYCRK